VENTYIPVRILQMVKSTQDRSRSVLKLYLLPTFGHLCLRDLTRLTIERYLTDPSLFKLSHESRDKIRDVLSRILRSAVEYGLLLKNPAEGVRLPAAKIGRRRSKFYMKPQQFEELLSGIPEPYATMVYVATFTGLRASELCGLRWNDVHESTITIDERFCRGDWGAPKSDASNATIPVTREVIERIYRLKLMTIEVNAGRAKRRYKVVKTDGPDDLVFQSVQKGRPMRDNNILIRHLKPAGRAMGMPWLNWRSLRTSHAVWLKMAGADVKDAQGQMRHSRASTTLDIYQQFVPASQRSVVDRLNGLATTAIQ
jgi:integrase